MSGLAGTGLVLDLGGQSLVVEKGATSFAFPEKVERGKSYAVTVKSQPLNVSQTCTVSGGSGTIAGDVANVAVTCTTNRYTLSATITGLSGSGLVLQNNGADDTAVAPSGSPRVASFASKVASGAPYAVTVKTQPVGQTCTVTGGTGTVVAGDVSTVAVNCINTYTIGGTVSGLAGTGLTLQNNLGDDAVVNANGSFAFPTPVLNGAAYSVTIKTQPTNPWQTCVLSNGTGTVAAANITSVSIVCTTQTYSVKGTVAGLSGAGLVLLNNGADARAVSGGATTFEFVTKVASGSPYNVTVQTAPTGPSQTCVVSNGSGTVTNADVTNVGISCTTNAYNVNVNVSGMVGTGLVLRNNGGNDLTINTNGAYAFSATRLSGTAYAVSVFTHSTGDTCYVSGTSSGIVTTAAVNVTVVCDRYKRVFVSSAAYNGNMGGLAGADAKCQQHATAANLPGTYKAWLSDGTGTPSTRFSVHSTPVVRVDGVRVVNNSAGFLSGTLLAAIDKTETGGAPSISNPNGCGGTAVFTNTNANGTQFASNASCTNWTSTVGQNGAHWGVYNSSGATWTSNCNGGSCAWTTPIYCMQQ